MAGSIPGIELDQALDRLLCLCQGRRLLLKRRRTVVDLYQLGCSVSLKPETKSASSRSALLNSDCASRVLSGLRSVSCRARPWRT